jgi:hypothetical protein
LSTAAASLATVERQGVRRLDEIGIGRRGVCVGCEFTPVVKADCWAEQSE